ncbi:MAG: aminoglycoside phosphotransferase family protein [Gammaproteobacteria bacterium]
MSPGSLPEPVLAGWELDAGQVRPLGAGLINQTWIAARQGGGQVVVQRVNPVFTPAVNEDIDAVTAHLEQRGLVTPRIVPARDGRLWLPAEAGASWRALTYVAGRSLDSLARPEQAEQAALLLGRFHRALDDLEHPFSGSRRPIHELSRHLRALQSALADRRDHPDYGSVARVAEAILGAADRLPALPVTPPRIVHGDPKINNVLFEPQADRAVCLVDLDTVGPMALPLELGDAMRSWCAPGGEDRREGEFSDQLFAAAVAGYARSVRGWIRREEVDAIVPATANIQVELAARFCADALNESYFSWDPERFPSASAHNLTRAAGQLALHRSLRSKQARLEDFVDISFAAA